MLQVCTHPNNIPKYFTLFIHFNITLIRRQRKVNFFKSQTIPTNRASLIRVVRDVKISASLFAVYALSSEQKLLQKDHSYIILKKYPKQTQ